MRPRGIARALAVLGVCLILGGCGGRRTDVDLAGAEPMGVYRGRIEGEGERPRKFRLLLYAAMPNLTGDLDEARAAFDQRLASSEILAQWWQEHVVSNGVDQEIDEMLDVLQPIGEALGAEAIVAVPLSVIRDQGVPLFMASTAMQLFEAGRTRHPEGDNQVVARIYEDIVGTGLKR